MFWIDGRGKAISTYELEVFSKINAEFFTRSFKRNIAVFQSDRAQTAQLLSLLDGVCARIFVVPAEARQDFLSDLFVRLDIDFLVTDQEIGELDTHIEIARLDYDSCIDDDSLILGGMAALAGEVNTEWIIATSGTTGSPKLVAHTLAGLSGSVKKDHVRGKEYRWGLLYDLSKYAGLQVYLQALVGGSILLVPDGASSLAQQIEYLASNDCNALSATPTLWRKILMLPASQNLPLKRITLGGEIADQAILEALAGQFPAAKIGHIYASTEAGVGFAVSDGLAGFPKAYLAESPQGVLMKVINDLLFLKSSNVSKTILNVDSYKDSDGYVDTGDLVELKGDRYYFRGRASGLINVGGNKVYPEEVEQVLLSHEQVRLARVYGKKSHLMGSLVACEIVVSNVDENSVTEFKKQVRRHCSRLLPDWKIPALFRIVDDIDSSDSGKQIRK